MASPRRARRPPERCLPSTGRSAARAGPARREALRCALSGGEGPVEQVGDPELGRPAREVGPVQRLAGHADDADDVAPLPIGSLASGTEPLQLQQDDVFRTRYRIAAWRARGVERFRRDALESRAVE